MIKYLQYVIIALTVSKSIDTLTNDLELALGNAGGCQYEALTVFIGPAIRSGLHSSTYLSSYLHPQILIFIRRLVYRCDCLECRPSATPSFRQINYNSIDGTQGRP